MTVIFWNVLFVSINLFQIIALLRQRRPVLIEEELMPIYNKVFSSMRKKDFLYLWKKGHVIEGEMKNSELYDKLYRILTVDISEKLIKSGS